MEIGSLWHLVFTWFLFPLFNEVWKKRLVDGVAMMVRLLSGVCACVWCVCVCVSGTPITFELPSLENLRERAERSIVNESFQLSIIWLKYSLKEEKDRMNTVGANLIIMRTKDSSSD